MDIKDTLRKIDDGITAGIRKFIDDHPNLKRSMYGDPMTIDINPRIRSLYDRAVATGDAILLTSAEDYRLMMCEWSYEQRPFDKEAEFDYEGNEIIGAFEPKMFGKETPNGSVRVIVTTSLVFLPPKPMHVTTKQMIDVKGLDDTYVVYGDNFTVVYWNGAQIIEVPDGQQDIDETLPINNANGIRLRTPNH